MKPEVAHAREPIQDSETRRTRRETQDAQCFLLQKSLPVHFLSLGPVWQFGRFRVLPDLI